MGKLNEGILGGFMGTVGTVIGSVSKKGDDLMRVKSNRPRTSNSDLQLKQRAKFKLVANSIHPLNLLLKNGLKLVAGDLMSPYNYACQHALTEAITGAYPDFELDYSKVQLSVGPLSQVADAGFELANKSVNFHWEDNTDTSNAQPTDKAVLLIYNVNNYQLSYTIGVATRVVKGGVLPLPNATAGDKVVIFMFFQSPDDPDVVSTSQYIGSTTVTE
jgi:hypothetical protein